ncbi:MAG: endonuclease III, partial [Candidatus Bathyarchaeota archaeon]|nr:endonuclease III [Candidatus Bathyarchaeum sp.]
MMETETELDKKTRLLKVIELLEKEYPKAKTVLHYSSPLEILVATILSAQCTDKRVNLVTPLLFKKYKTAKDYANADLAELEKDIRSTGFYRNKAKNIKNAGKMIVEQFDSQVPQTMEEILELPGVARKTANIVLSNAYGIIVGIAVDTHVRRLSMRLGLTENTNPDKIEKDLMLIVPKSHWKNITNLLISHG